MAKFEGFSAGDQITIQKVYKSARLGLEKCVASAGSGEWRTRFNAWMGVATGGDLKSAETTLQKSISNMFMRVGTVSFKVLYDATLPANAEMTSFAGKSPEEVTNEVDAFRSQNKDWNLGSGKSGTEGGMMTMRIGPALFAMPFRSLSVQSQVETFLHELSHHAAGTIDDKNGGECYELVGVTRLKGLGPARAVRNAENVGFFCTEWCS
jgi:hypothetical protein